MEHDSELLRYFKNSIQLPISSQTQILKTEASFQILATLQRDTQNGRQMAWYVL